jgi:PIN domain nuclease of toxin-antitoxin system
MLKGARFGSVPWWNVGLIAVAVLLPPVAWKVLATPDRQLTALENILLWELAVLAGLFGSYAFGKLSAQTAAREMLKPAAKSAFRRVLTLNASLARLASTLSEDSGIDPQIRLAVGTAILREEVATTVDSLEDWRDLVPDEVADVERRLELSATAAPSVPTDENSQ